MKTRRTVFVIFIICLFFAGLPLYAQDAFGGIFDENESGENEETDQTAASSPADATGNFSLSGNVGSLSTWYLADDPEDQKSLFQVPAELLLEFKSDVVEAMIRLTLDSAANFDSLAPETVLDEARLRIFSRYLQFDLGLMKMEWGKGDGLHALDPLNSLDQRSGPKGDLNSMKKSELMAVVSVFPSLNSKLELVYKPFFHPYLMAHEGRWMVSDLSALPNLQDAPDTETAEYSQAAARFTTSVGSADLGVLYYYGFFGEPGYQIQFTDPMNPATYFTDMVFTRAQLFGLEAAAAVSIFTLRAELGFWLSEDTSGDIAHLYNNRFSWLGGFDFMIPGTQVFVSIQEMGKYVLDLDDSNPSDVDLGASADGLDHANTLVAAIESSFLKDKLKVRLSGLWAIESDSFMIMPSVFFYPFDNLEIELSARIIDGRDSGANPYYAWRENDSVSLGVNFVF